MNCWKSINIRRDYGTLRITLFSIIVMLSYFIIFYLIFSAFHHEKKFFELGLLPFLLGLCIILPLHKLIHLLPLLLSKTKIEFSFSKNKKLPLPCFLIEEKVPKNITMLSMLLPFVSLTLIAIIGSILFPNFFHYFAIFSAINLGISVIDLLFIYQISQAPSHAVIENSKVGIDILVNNN
jgi:hypothetical protein